MRAPYAAAAGAPARGRRRRWSSPQRARAPGGTGRREVRLEFMDAHVYPAEPIYHRQVEESGDPHFEPPIMDELKAEARRRGLWNLFLPHETEWGGGLSNLDYAPLAEITGRSGLAPE